MTDRFDLDDQAARVDATPAAVLSCHLELFARTFLPADARRPDGQND